MDTPDSVLLKRRFTILFYSPWAKRKAEEATQLPGHSPPNKEGMPVPWAQNTWGEPGCCGSLGPGRAATLPAPQPRVPHLQTEAHVVTIVLASLQHPRLGRTDFTTTAPVAINNE